MSRDFDAITARPSTAVDESVSPFIPILILGLVLAGWFGFQAIQLRAERLAMIDLLATQSKQVEESKKLRNSLDLIARATVRLAEEGNPNAKTIVDELKKRGITISAKSEQPPATSSEPVK